MTSYRKSTLQLFVIALLVSLFISTAYSQKIIENTPEKQRVESYEKHLLLKDNSIFKNLDWQFVGPINTSGRMTDVAVVTPKGENYTIYAAGASGGLWKTENEGNNWEPIFEHAMSTSIGDIALDPNDQNTLWVGTGEANIFRSSQAGAGVYRTKDGGKNWEHLGLVNTNTISRIIVHPKNSDVVYVAASGNEWTNNEERGIYKTTDGGKSWNKILYIDEKTGIIDMAMDPTDNNIIYAASWQRIRKKWNDPRNEADYTGSGILKTTDGGVNWSQINQGLPQAQYRGRIGIDLCKANPKVLYAFIDNYENLKEEENSEAETDAYGRPSSGRIKGASVFKTTNGGGKWKQVSEQNSYMEGLSGTYGWVFGQITVDPVNENKLYIMGLGLNLSEDGGKTWRSLRGMHGDHHGLWIDPDNTDYLVNVNDGGIAISYDGGKHFKAIYDNLPLVQFFNVNYDMDEPFHIYGSIQDHGSQKGTVDLSNGRNSIPAVAFQGAPGGEGSQHEIDPTDPNLVYSAGFYGTLSLTNIKTGERDGIMPATPEGGERLRGQWIAPFIISPHNPKIIYHGTQFVHRSMNMGKSWERISNDLTYNKDEMKGDIPYQTIFTLSESPFKFGLLYAGTDDGRLWITHNSGTKWNEITESLPYRKWMSRVIASKYDEGTVFLTQNGKREDDFVAYIWKSTDYGQTWTDISSNIPSGPVNIIREDPKKDNILYVGTDWGVYVSIDKGESWSSLAGDFPTTYVHDLVIHPRDNIMIAATHGRGMWAMDVEYIQNLDQSTIDQECSIMSVSEAKLPYSTNWWYRNSAKYPQFVTYLKNAQKISISITNSDGEKVYEKKEQLDGGLNFIEWDLNNYETKKMVSEGLYKFQIKGKAVMQEQEFEVLSSKN